jgi:elongation of very long chain fatty acids protein 7
MFSSFTVWWGLKFIPGGHSTLFGLLNSFVHIMMYAYYLMAAMGPAVQKHLWWKKYLTTLQMAQFVVVLVHSFQLLISNPCGYSLASVAVGAFHAFLFLVLFSKFYSEAYRKKVCGFYECESQ